MMKAITALATLALIVAALASPQAPAGYDLPGFPQGVLQGVISPLVLMFGWIFKQHIYTSPNAGFLYDLGWMLGLLVFWYAAATLTRSDRQYRE